MSVQRPSLVQSLVDLTIAKGRETMSNAWKKGNKGLGSGAAAQLMAATGTGPVSFASFAGGFSGGVDAAAEESSKPSATSSNAPTVADVVMSLIFVSTPTMTEPAHFCSSWNVRVFRRICSLHSSASTKRTQPPS